MIIGIGSDILDIRRIERTIERHGDRFLERIFTSAERAKAEKRTERIRAATYAKRFAAKEAASKALGTGFRAGVFWRDLGAITPAGHGAVIALTMTDEFPYAQAMVVITAVPLP
jgi:holo-[acyl-carrier protein] synthase